MTIRDTINGIREELRQHPPADTSRCSELIVMLTALQGNVHDEIGRWEAVHLKNMSDMLDADPKLGVEKLKIKAQAMEPYTNLQTAKRVAELTNEMIQGLKYRFRSLEQEWREAHNQ